jgi:hypothetical protein
MSSFLFGASSMNNHFYLTQIHTIKNEKSYIEQHCNDIESHKPCTLVRFEPTIYWSVGGDNDRFTKQKTKKVILSSTAMI